MISLWFLVQLWREGELFGVREVLFGVWFVLAFLAQAFAPIGSGVWLVGLLAQVGLAIVLVLKDKIDHIY